MKAYEDIAERVHEKGAIRLGGVLLRETAGEAEVACRDCGPLELNPRETIPGRTPAWEQVAHVALDHARETGHRIAVSLWGGAIYGPEDEAGP